MTIIIYVGKFKNMNSIAVLSLIRKKIHINIRGNNIGYAN